MTELSSVSSVSASSSQEVQSKKTEKQEQDIAVPVGKSTETSEEDFKIDGCCITKEDVKESQSGYKTSAKTKKQVVKIYNYYILEIQKLCPKNPESVNVALTYIEQLPRSSKGRKLDDYEEKCASIYKEFAKEIENSKIAESMVNANEDNVTQAVTSDDTALETVESAGEPKAPKQEPQKKLLASMIKNDETFRVTNAQNKNRPVEGHVSGVEQDNSGEVISFSITTKSGNAYSYKRNEDGTYVQLDSQGNETAKKYELNSDTGNLERINDKISSKPAEKKSSAPAVKETPAEERKRTVLYKTLNGDYMTKNDKGDYEYFNANGKPMTEENFKKAHSTVNTQIQKDKDNIEKWNSQNPNMKVNIENQGKQLSTTVTYGGKKVKVTADSFDGLKLNVQAQLKKMKASESQRYEYTKSIYNGGGGYAALGRAMQR